MKFDIWQKINQFRLLISILPPVTRNNLYFILTYSDYLAIIIGKCLFPQTMFFVKFFAKYESYYHKECRGASCSPRGRQVQSSCASKDFAFFFRTIHCWTTSDVRLIATHPLWPIFAAFASCHIVQSLVDVAKHGSGAGAACLIVRRQQLAGTWGVVQLAVEDQLRLLVQLLFNTLIDSDAKDAEQYILSLFKDL